MIAAPHDLVAAAVLAFVNDAREALGLAPVPALRGGERLNPWFCPICRTIGEGAPAQLQVEFSGTRLRVWRRGTTLIVLQVDAPAIVVRWSEDFDRGRRDGALSLPANVARAEP
jgi:hypothetical protein